MTKLLPYTQWLSECHRLRLPLDTPAPPHYQSFEEWYRNSRGVDITGKPALKSHGEWITERVRLGLPANAPAPEGYERYDEWFKRMRGVDPVTGKPITPSSELGHLYRELPAAKIAPKAEPSSFLRRAMSGAGEIANRLGKIGSAVRGSVPVLGAASTIIHAIREGRDRAREGAVSHDLRADHRASSGPMLG